MMRCKECNRELSGSERNELETLRRMRRLLLDSETRHKYAATYVRINGRDIDTIGNLIGCAQHETAPIPE